VSSPEQRDAPVGGQAVLEGVMMRGVSTWAVATRKDGEIAVESHPVVSWVSRSRALRWPVIRGVDKAQHYNVSGIPVYKASGQPSWRLAS
jgi:uncharacterized protein YqhQ